MTDPVTVLMEQIIAKMTVISEQQARSYDGITVSGGERNGGLASLIEKPMVDYWRDRFNGAKSPRSRRIVVLEAAEALKVARVMPIPKGQEPEFGSPQWKHYVAQSREDAGEIARRFHVTRRYINQVRQQYRAA